MFGYSGSKLTALDGVDLDDARKRLEQLEADVSAGKILGSHARLKIGKVEFSIKEARKFLGEKRTAIINAKLP